ncbi:chemotaxis protein CheX [Arcobacter sp.]|uniref:chemotaxis protein CheX n=1 Tax=Arcobacter sp. TaxID=1872629 RepID=UPI003D0C91C7
MYDTYKELLLPILERLREFLKKDMGIDVLNENSEIIDAKHIVLKKDTVFIGTGGSVQLFVTMGYDKELLAKLVDVFYVGDFSSEEEYIEIKESVACEIANIVIGNAIKNPVDNSIIKITPPILIHDAKSLTKYKNSIILRTDINTNIGNLQMTVIGPQELFLEKLNLKGNIKC